MLELAHRRSLFKIRYVLCVQVYQTWRGGLEDKLSLVCGLTLQFSSVKRWRNVFSEPLTVYIRMVLWRGLCSSQVRTLSLRLVNFQMASCCGLSSLGMPTTYQTFSPGSASSFLFGLRISSAIFTNRDDGSLLDGYSDSARLSLQGAQLGPPHTMFCPHLPFSHVRSHRCEGRLSSFAIECFPIINKPQNFISNMIKKFICENRQGRLTVPVLLYFNQSFQD